jgi:hypothetical protein
MMRLVSPDASREDTYATWLAWVEANLGPNKRLASITARAAADAASQEAGPSRRWIGIGSAASAHP